MQLTLSSRVKRNPGLLASKLDNEYVMMNMQENKYFGLNTIGSRIWELLEQPVVINELVEQLLREYKVSKDHCAQDVLEYLEVLKNKKMIEVLEA